MMTTKDVFYITFLLSCRRKDLKPLSENEFWINAKQSGFDFTANGDTTYTKFYIKPGGMNETFQYLKQHGANPDDENSVEQAIHKAKQTLIVELFGSAPAV